MRILMTTTSDPNALASCYLRAFDANSAEIHTVDLGSGVRSPPSLSERAMRRAFPHLAYRTHNAALLWAATEVKPDVILIFKGMEISPATLRKLKDRGITLANYNADHPFAHFSRGSGNANVRNAIPLYDGHITYSRHIAAELTRRYPGTAVSIVPFGHEVGADAYARISALPEIPRACFLGNPDAHRQQNLRALLAAGVPLDVYGHGWSRFLQPQPNLVIHPPALGHEMLATLRRYRMQLNFFRPHNVHSHNMRTFEVPACGGIMLAQDSIEHRDFFAADREAFYFSTPQEMIDKARHLLALSSEEAAAVRVAARARSMTSGYSYKDRAAATLAVLRQIPPSSPANTGVRTAQGNSLQEHPL